VAAATTVWAQQPFPEAAAAEAALRARAEQFFQLQVDKKYRQAEALVAEDSKDAYYDDKKFSIKSFTIEKVELLDGNAKARVTIKAKVTVLLPAQAPIEIEAPSTSQWKLDNGQWAYYVEQGVVETPFGKLDPRKSVPAIPPLDKSGKAPDRAALQALVKVDRNSVVLTSEEPTQTVTVSNDLPGAIDLVLAGNQIEGVSADLQAKHLEAGEKTTLKLSAKDGGSHAGVVSILVAPLNTQLDIQVTTR